MGILYNASEQEFKSYLKNFTQEFDLISITEQFDLSVLLSRRKLCWDISDMIYIPIKKANFTYSQNSHFTNITKNESINNKYKILNPNAYFLYDHSKTILSRKISQAGQDLQEEYVFFQKLQENVTNFCSKYIEMIDKDSTKFLDVLKTADVLAIPASKWGSARTFDPIECALLKFYKNTFLGISAAKSLAQNPYDMYVKHVNKIRNKNKRKMYLSFHEPVHPKYGIPLLVLTDAHAYDLDKNPVTYKEMIRGEKRLRQERHHLNMCHGVTNLPRV